MVFFQKYATVIGAAYAFMAVALGAFGAHALKTRITPEDLAIYETGVRYQMYHALALILVAQSAASNVWSCAGFIIGVPLFSFSLYAIVGTGIRSFGAMTPLGGLAFLLAWAAFAFSALKRV